MRNKKLKIIYIILVSIVIAFVGCAYKISDFRPANKKDTILYDFSEDGKIEKAKEIYGRGYRDNL